MPYRAVVSAELAKLFGILSHPVRVRMIVELQKEDLSVNSLKDILGITHAAASQQLAVLRNGHLVTERRQGRNVFYRLRKPDLASWIMDGVGFISPDKSEVDQILSAIQSAKTMWKQDEGSEKSSSSPSPSTSPAPSPPSVFPEPKEAARPGNSHHSH